MDYLGAYYSMITVYLYIDIYYDLSGLRSVVGSAIGVPPVRLHLTVHDNPANGCYGIQISTV